MQPDICLVIDSMSSDDTVNLAKQAGCKVIIVDRNDYDHGGTRQLGVSLLSDCEIIIFLTQDALLYAPDSIDQLVSCFRADNSIGAAYGRQIPHDNANPIAAHARYFNYPPKSEIRSFLSRETLGIKAAFCSNSFAAWRLKSIGSAGGFPPNQLFAEDMLLAAKILRQGEKVAYSAKAIIAHSHNYSMGQEFRRYFDIGAFHRMESWVGDCFGRASGEGFRFIKSEFQYLSRFNTIWKANALVRNILKFTGFWLGSRYVFLPKWLVFYCTSQPNWWSRFFSNKHLCPQSQR